ncbi:MAG: hypothetical protein O2921_09155 [Chloroflexi bacterium]|nr:hypothetical protein [Chloroflexota bacterium]MDA1282769.1 hypothetical protein [Chloroflexota bacterium]
MTKLFLKYHWLFLYGSDEITSDSIGVRVRRPDGTPVGVLDSARSLKIAGITGDVQARSTEYFRN